MKLDLETFNEQIASLRADYPGDARNLTVAVGVDWFKKLKGFDQSAFIKGIIRARESSPARLPTLPTIERCIREVEYEAESRKRSQDDLSGLNQITKNTINNQKSRTHKEMAKDIMKVLQSGDITPKKWRDLSIKYAEIWAQDAPGKKMKAWFMGRAMLLAKHRLETRRAIRKEKNEIERIKREERAAIMAAEMELRRG